MGTFRQLRRDLNRARKAELKETSEILPTVSAWVRYMPTSAWSGYRPLTESDRADVLELAQREGIAVVLYDGNGTPEEVATPEGEWVTHATWQARERRAERGRFETGRFLTPRTPLGPSD